MAPARKSAVKRTAKKKGRGAKGATASKRPGSKAATKRSTKRGKAGTRKPKRGSSLRAAGEKTWKLLKSTTEQVVDGVREKLGD
jgi:hypothetical protein